MATVTILPIKNRAVAVLSNAIPISLNISNIVANGAVNRVVIARKAGYQVLHTLGNVIYYAGFVERAKLIDIQGALYAPCAVTGDAGGVSFNSVLNTLGRFISVGSYTGKCVEVSLAYVAGPISAFSMRLVGA